MVLYLGDHDRSYTILGWSCGNSHRKLRLRPNWVLFRKIRTILGKPGVALSSIFPKGASNLEVQTFVDFNLLQISPQVNHWIIESASIPTRTFHKAFRSNLPQTSWPAIPGWWELMVIRWEYRILRTRKFPTMSRFHQASCGFFPHFSDTNPCWYFTVLIPHLSGVQLQAIQKQKQCSFSNQPHQIPKRWHQYRTSPDICETEIVCNEVECAQSADCNDRWNFQRLGGGTITWPPKRWRSYPCSRSRQKIPKNSTHSNDQQAKICIQCWLQKPQECCEVNQTTGLWSAETYSRPRRASNSALKSPWYNDGADEWSRQPWAKKAT